MAAVGLTLTCASRLYLFEPGVNLAAEQQAISRVHRFGQQRAVHVIKLVLDSTVETSLARLNRQKHGGSAGASSSSSSSTSS